MKVMKSAGKLFAILFALNVAGSFAARPAFAADFGKFLDQLQVELLVDGRRLKLLNDYRYEDARGNLWTAKKDWIVDGASIPQVFWSVIGGPLEGPYRNASVIHDYYCDKKERDWRSTHRTFFEAMRANNVQETKAKIMYYAVVAFGPRWETVTTMAASQQNCTVINERMICMSVPEQTKSELIAIRPTINADDVANVSAIAEQIETGRIVSVDDLERIAIQAGNQKFPTPFRR